MQDSNSNMAIEWTDMDKESLSQKEVIIFKQNIVERDMKNSELPTDIHLIDYTHNSQNYTDAVRSYKMTSIFDVYHDKLRSMGGGVVTRIRNGYGNIKPVLFNNSQKQEKK